LELRHWQGHSLAAATREAREDQHFMRAMLDASTSEQGMRLGRLDAAIVHNRKLLKRLYLGEPALNLLDLTPKDPSAQRTLRY